MYSITQLPWTRQDQGPGQKMPNPVLVNTGLQRKRDAVEILELHFTGFTNWLCGTKKKTKKKASKILYSAFQWYWYLINLLRACKFCNSFNEAFPNKGKEKWTYFYALHIIFFFNFLHFLYRMSMFSSVFALFTWVNEVCHVSFASINLSCSELSWNKFLFICDVNWYQPRRWPWTPGDEVFVIYNQCKVTTVVMTTSVYLSIS